MILNKNILTSVLSGSGTAIYTSHETVTTVMGSPIELAHLIVYALIGGAAGYVGKLLIDGIIFLYKKNQNT